MINPNPILETINDNRVTVPEFILPLTKREQFAAMAMQGLLSTPVKAGVTEEDICILSVRAADALLEELENDK